ncbi:HDL562Cp [Eremothecium sinecaudum]|uniref:HDL562Cp n=1 Tax=Eremothecium sinecaudum TaxID=45286 RepID=A0A0X8HRL7_9SACH|nr:HDL562Cp [Eremothecium sinecaudum]AMD20182.1 HDL562Cp [Eremothecium sinecaudum]
MPYPKVAIVFCDKCRWNLRSAWYLQELLQTFGDSIKELSLVPGPVGLFQVLGYLNKEQEDEAKPLLIWDRKVNGGFPDSKLLKQKVKALIFAEDDQVKIGAHISRSKAEQQNEGLLISEDCKEDDSDCAKRECEECNT